MSTTLLVGLLAAAGVVVTAFVTWLVSKRTNSGNIATSDAASLWTESSQMRQDLRTEVAALRTSLGESVAKLEAAVIQIAELLHRVELSNAATTAAIAESKAARAETAELRKLMDDVHNEIRTGNALTLGALADQAESRRIALIPVADRTAAETSHIDQVKVTTTNGGAK